MTQNLRRKVHIKLAKHGLSTKGYKKKLADKANLPYQQMIMALSGYREDQKSYDILAELDRFLDTL